MSTEKLMFLLKQSILEEAKLLKEIGENTYEFSAPEINVISPKENIVTYTFTNSKGTEYEVSFESTYSKKNEGPKWETEVEFDPVSKGEEEEEEMFSWGDEKELGDIDEFDAMAVLYTVAKIIGSFIKEFKPESLSYTGIYSRKEIPGKSTMTKRDRIYDAILNRMITQFPEYGSERSGSLMNIFYKGELPVPGHHKIFDYPV